MRKALTDNYIVYQYRLAHVNFSYRILCTSALKHYKDKTGMR